MISVKQSVDFYMEYLRTNSRPNTVRNFKYTLIKFNDEFGDKDLTTLSYVDILLFLNKLTENSAPATKSCRAGHISALFNFTSEAFDLIIPNPCHKGIIRKLYKNPRQSSPRLLDKDIINEIIYKAEGKNRLMLELMGRTAMRVGEVLNIKPRNFNQDLSALTIEQPKSGRVGEAVFLPKKMMRKLEDYVRDKDIKVDSRVFTVSYSTIYRTVKRLGSDVGVKLRPHDLRRHAATQASRAGVPLEIVSKVILRHTDLTTTQRYLGKVDGVEANRIIESLLG